MAKLVHKPSKFSFLLVNISSNDCPLQNPKMEKFPVTFRVNLCLPMLSFWGY